MYVRHSWSLINLHQVSLAERGNTWLPLVSILLVLLVGTLLLLKHEVKDPEC